jgi:hypothetical protein
VKEEKTIDDGSPGMGRETHQGNRLSWAHRLLCLIGHSSAMLGARLKQKGLPQLPQTNSVGHSDC